MTRYGLSGLLRWVVEVVRIGRRMLRRRETWAGNLIVGGVLLNGMDVGDEQLQSMFCLRFPQTIYPYNPTQHPSRTNNQHTQLETREITFSGIVVVL